MKSELKLKPIPANIVIHTPTEAEVKELLAILHENGWKWFVPYSGEDSDHWDEYRWKTCYNLRKRELIDFEERTFYEEEGYAILTLSEFKERYCEEEKPQPMFKVGDKVIALFGALKLNATIIGIDEYGDYAIEDSEGHKLFHYTDVDLEPYTEPETKPTEDMDAKELNFCELLHEGDTVYSLIDGEGKVELLDEDGFRLNNWCFRNDGTLAGSDSSTAKCLIYPSRALYEQYPLDPYTGSEVAQGSPRNSHCRYRKL